MSLVTSINCRVSRRWGLSWWAGGLLRHHSQALNCSQSQKMFLLFSTSGILQTVDFTSAVNKLWHCHDSAHLLCRTWRKGADKKRFTRICSWPAKEQYAITRVKSIQYYQHMFDSVLQWQPIHKSCHTLSLNHLQCHCKSLRLSAEVAIYASYVTRQLQVPTAITQQCNVILMPVRTRSLGQIL